MKKRAIIFLTWGENFAAEVESCLALSTGIEDYDCFLITDDATQIRNDRLKVIRARFRLDGYLRKTELPDYLPDGYDSFLFLDSDTRVLADPVLGFEKAEQFGMALAPAPHYSLDCFWGFDKVMKAENVECRGQLQYNTGVIFFRRSPEVAAVFERWRELGKRYNRECNLDQPLLTLAMEQLALNPYTLSISYNYRGFGEAISGIVRIWHSHGPMPENINQFEKPWPPRRAIPGEVIRPSAGKDKVSGWRNSVNALLKKLDM